LEDTLAHKPQDPKVKRSDKVPSGKLIRSAITGVGAAKVGLKHIGYLGKSSFASEDEKQAQKENHEQEIGRTLVNTFMQLRGTALKLGQMLSMDQDFFPETIRKELLRACHQVIPLNRAHIRKAFIQQLESPPEKLFQQFESTAFAAASLGQVHKAILKDGQEVAVKIQYPGIASSIQSDVKIIQSLLLSLSGKTSYLPSKPIIRRVMSELEERLQEEVDYTIEANYTQWFSENVHHPHVQIPKVIPEFSTERVITTTRMQGKHLKEWLATNPSQEQRNHVGQVLFDIFIHQAFKLNIVHADPHPGNYLIQDSGNVVLLDFGCVKKLNPTFLKNIRKLYSGDIKRVYQGYTDLTFIPKSMDFKSFMEDFYQHIESLHQHIVEPLLQSPFDFAKKTSLSREDHKKVNKVTDILAGIDQDQMYFDRAYLGMIQMLREIRAVVKTKNEWMFG
jgi:predicted unusual protein kinase regulating ubiquinone biosynthesis (AarF/ABC1/UbiB family)